MMSKPLSIMFALSLFATSVLAGLARGQDAAPAPKQDAGSDQAREPENKESPVYVTLETTKGQIVLELNREKAPITVDNFLRYLDKEFFDGTIFHRVIPGFMIQGGGFTPDMQQKATEKPIKNEWKNGLKNERGTIAMARTSNPDSATAQFFINHRDNRSLDGGDVRTGGVGYAVFGRVVEGMNVVDAIADVATTTKSGHENVPAEPVVIEKARRLSQEEVADLKDRLAESGAGAGG